MLMRPRDLHMPHHPQKNRHRIPRQPLPGMRSKLSTEIGVQCLALAEDEGGTAGAAVVVGQLDAVAVGFSDGGVVTQGFGDLGRGDVFRFPAEGVADSVCEFNQSAAVSRC